MTDTWDDLRDFYEHEAKLRRRRPPRGRRVELRDRFLDLMDREGLRSIIDFGAGPGGDGVAFKSAGHRFVGIDLAAGNGRLAAENGLAVIQGSITTIPVRARSFDAGWSLSTLMHLGPEEADTALAEMTAVLRTGAPLLLGLWGSEDERLVFESSDGEHCRRPFHFRSHATNASMISDRFTITTSERWEPQDDGSDYHVFWCRNRS